MTIYPYQGNRYLNFNEIEQFCLELAERFPNWVRLSEIGKTQHGRTIYLLTLGNQNDEIEKKPAIWIDGGTHSSEWTGVMACLYTVSQWLEKLQAEDPEIMAWFNHATAHIVPCISPDGFAAMMSGAPFIRSSLRKGNETSVRHGFEPCDVNQDNEIRWMRWKDPAGPFVIDETLPILMRPRTVDDSPEDAYYCTFEGEFINWDGTKITAAELKYGLDLNRNFPGAWQPFSMYGMDGGDFALSEPESRAVVTAFSERPFICAAITNHTYGGCILTQPYRSNSSIQDDDINLMHTLAKQLVGNTGYKTYKACPDFMYKPDRPISGVWSESISTVFGVPGYTVELWNLFNYIDENQIAPLDYFFGKDVSIIRTVLTKLIDKHPNIVTPWEVFKHHQLGEVEIGGVDYMRSIRNPPESVLKLECETSLLIANRLRKSIPNVQCKHEVSEVKPNIFKVTAILENTGFLPSSGLKHGETIRSTPKVTLQLKVPENAKILHGEETYLPSHLNGWGNAISEDLVAKNPIYPFLSQTTSQVKVSWMVEGKGLYSIDWVAGRAGANKSEFEIF